jgi:hypothetical protein
MLSKENESQEMFAAVKKELAALKAAIKKSELPHKEKTAILNSHEVIELFIEKKDDTSQQATAFEKGKRKPQTFDVSPGDHTLVEL